MTRISARSYLGCLGRGRLLASLLSGGDLFEALLLGLLVLRLVLHQHLEELGGLVLVDSLGELIDRRGHLKALNQDLLT